MRNPLKDALQSYDLAPPTRILVGTVTSTTPLQVDLLGSSGLTASYINTKPALGDQVLIAAVEPDLIIFGTINTGG